MKGTVSEREKLYSRCDKNYGVVGCNRIIVINLEFVVYLFNGHVRTESLQCAVVKLKARLQCAEYYSFECFEYFKCCLYMHTA